MTRDEEIEYGMQAFRDALRYDAVASTREDMAGVEESYWIAFNKLRSSPLKEHRLICARCLEAVAHILDGEGRREGAKDMRREAEGFRKLAETETPPGQEE